VSDTELREIKFLISELRQQLEVWETNILHKVKRIEEDFYKLDEKVNRLITSHNTLVDNFRDRKGP